MQKGQHGLSILPTAFPNGPQFIDDGVPIVVSVDKPCVDAGNLRDTVQAAAMNEGGLVTPTLPRLHDRVHVAVERMDSPAHRLGVVDKQAGISAMLETDLGNCLGAYCRQYG